MTDPAECSAMPNSSEDLDRILVAVCANITVGGAELKESVARLEQALRAMFRKDALQQLVSRIASAASSHENAFGLFIRALQQVPGPVAPETAIRGLLLRKTRVEDDHLLFDVIVWCLAPDAVNPEGTKKGQAPEVVVFSPPLFRDLKRNLGERFPLLGVHVWDRAIGQRNNAMWCEAWARFSMNVLQAAIPIGKDQRRQISAEYVRRICQADSGSARRILALILFLQEELGPLEDEVEYQIRSSPLGAGLARQVSVLLPELKPAAGFTGQSPGRPASAVDSINAKVASKNESNAVTDGETGFEDLPVAMVVGLKSVVSNIRSLVKTQSKSMDEQVMLRRQLSDEVDRLTTELRKRAECQEELRSELAKTRDERDSELKSQQELEKERTALRQTMGGLEKQLRTAQEDYERLSHRSQQELGEIRQHVLDGLRMDLRDTWELMARMLDMILKGQRDPRLLVGVWNQLDEIVWNRLGAAGYPVDEPLT